MTIILVSHSMEDVAKVANRIIVMDNGKCILDGTPEKVFKEIDTIRKCRTCSTTGNLFN